MIFIRWKIVSLDCNINVIILKLINSEKIVKQ